MTPPSHLINKTISLSTIHKAAEVLRVRYASGVNLRTHEINMSREELHLHLRKAAEKVWGHE